MRASSTDTARATLLIVASAASFGSLSALSLLTTRAGLPLIPSMLWRYLLAGAFLFVLMRRERGGPVPLRKAAQLMLIGCLGQAAITYLSLYALNYLAVAPLAFLFYTYPAWLAITAAARGKEKLTYARVLALVTAMIGISVMIGAPSAESLNTTGVILALGTAFLYSLYLPAIHSAQKDVPPFASTFFLIAGVASSFFVAALVTGELQLPATAKVWGYVLTMAGFCTVIAFSTLLAGLRRLGPVRTGIIATVEPFFSAVAGVILLHEALTAGTLVGGALIATAVILLHWHGARIKQTVAG
ncbi:MAG TPA: DMT family transporter [Gemmatimonadaceae bacterium]|nr:DMT family transporter [Gemmatimonadaceae bacterium]